MSKKKIAIIFGGASSEYEVSLLSSASVLKNISLGRFDVVNVGITKDGRWFKYDGSVEKIESGEWTDDESNLTACVVSPDTGVHGLLYLKKDGSFEAERIDAVFPVLHGRNGEDGTIQGLFTLAKIPFVGCDLISSAICMDKAVTNALLDHFGIMRAPWASVLKRNIGQFDGIERRLRTQLLYPMFVKPANAGSSVGITKAHNKDELFEALNIAFQHDVKAVVEKTIVGKELECAVCGNESPTASDVGEIVPCNEFYDYDAKYLAGTSETLIPARITDEQTDTVRQTAVRAYTLLGCSGLSRVDFLLEEATGEVYLNELNTIPGFTSISMYPKMMAHSGTPYDELISKLIELAIERTEEK